MDGFTALKLALNGNYGDIADAIDPLGQSIEFERGTAFVGVKGLSLSLFLSRYIYFIKY